MHAGNRHEAGSGSDSLIHWAGLYDLAMRAWGRRGQRWRSDLADRLALGPGERVLDVASGTGQLALEMARRVVPDGSVDGIDASPEMVARATRTACKLGANTVQFQVGRAQRLPFADSTFAAVTCTAAWHHIAGGERAIVVG